MKYLGLSNFGGMSVYSSWLLPNGQIIHIDFDRPDYFEYINVLKGKDGEVLAPIS